jgi:hypothetical protein
MKTRLGNKLFLVVDLFSAAAILAAVGLLLGHLNDDVEDKVGQNPHNAVAVSVPESPDTAIVEPVCDGVLTSDQRYCVSFRPRPDSSGILSLTQP